MMVISFQVRALMLAAFSIQLIVSATSQQQTVAEEEEEDKHQGKNTYGTHQWNHRDYSFESENEINSITNQRLISAINNNNKHRAQFDYSCGKAMAEKKYKDFLLNEQGYQVTRNKYRPTEIRMPRIIGGDETTPGEFPWTASVKLNNQPICGGSLIERNWILTAAHCVVGYNPKNLTIRLGAYRIKDTSETQTIDLTISMFIVHKDYSMPRPFSNDIALLKLSEPVDYTDFIIPICLPKADSSNPVSMDDYSSNRIDHSPTTGSSINSNRAGDETGGIVVSTKMSDLDIAKCFTKLEQNYLQSIGLGPIVEAISEQEASPQTHSITTTTTTAPSSNQQHLFASNDIEIVVPAGGIKPGQKVIFAQQKTRKPPTTVSQQNFEQTFTMNVNSQQGGNSKQNGFVYYNLPWSKITEESNEQKRRMRSMLDDQQDSRRDNKIKLSRLPINKELLREIQSVGSSAMQTLGLQQGDIAALANELTNQEQQSYHSGNTEREKLTNFRNQQVTTISPSRSFGGPFDEDQLVDDPSQYSSGQSGIVVGWGWVRELDGDDQLNKGYPSVTLQKVKLPILRNNVCEAWFQSQAKKITLLPSQFCAGFNSGGKDACRGDSGGPMIIEDSSNSGRFTLVGIVSAGIGCARPSLPGLYTRVASFLPWINAQMLRY